MLTKTTVLGITRGPARARLWGPTAAKGSLYTNKDDFFLFVSEYNQDYDLNRDGLKSSIKGDSSKKTKQQLYRFGYISWFKFMLNLQVIHNLKAIIWLNSPDQVRQWPARPDCPRSSGFSGVLQLLLLVLPSYRVFFFSGPPLKS